MNLFFSPLLSKDLSTSCATCHPPSRSYSGDRPLAVGVSGFTAQRRAPTLYDVGNAPLLMWDGRAADLISQVVMPLESPEMAIDWPDAILRLNADPELAIFREKRHISAIDRDLTLQALAAYVATIRSGPTRFDRYYYGHEQLALTNAEARGFRLFVRKARCASCHLINSQSAPFTDYAFHVTGVGLLDGKFVDIGRGAISGDLFDNGGFKTPTLRGVALRPYLMHDGSMRTLRETINHYNNVNSHTDQRLDERLEPLFLEPAEVDDLIAFLGALNPENPSER